MILRNPTSMSFLKSKMSPSGEILAHSHNDFLGSTEDALCHEP